MSVLAAILDFLWDILAFIWGTVKTLIWIIVGVPLCALVAVCLYFDSVFPDLLHKKQICPRCGQKELEYNGVVEVFISDPPADGWYECHHCGATLRKSSQGDAWEDVSVEADSIFRFKQ